MKSRNHWLLIVLAVLCLVELGAAADSSKVLPELVGTWDYTSMTALKNNKPFGTVHFQPGQWTVTFNQGATWVMKLLSDCTTDLNLCLAAAYADLPPTRFGITPNTSTELTSLRRWIPQRRYGNQRWW